MPSQKKLPADALDPLPERARVSRQGLRGIKAWIAQWVSTDVADRPLQQANPSDRSGVVYVGSPRLSHHGVCECAKAIYLAELGEPAFILRIYRMERAAGRSPGAHPVEPVYAEVEAEIGGEILRGPLTTRFRFGRDPCLYVRQVENLRERRDGTLDWSEIPISPAPRARTK